MTVKGIVSAIYEAEHKISVILPEFGEVATQPLPVYPKSAPINVEVNDFVLVVMFSGDYGNAVVVL